MKSVESDGQAELKIEAGVGVRRDVGGLCTDHLPSASRLPGRPETDEDMSGI